MLAALLKLFVIQYSINFPGLFTFIIQLRYWRRCLTLVTLVTSQVAYMKHVMHQRRARQF